MGSKNKWLWAGLTLLVLSATGILLTASLRDRDSATAAAPAASSPLGVACLGHIEPLDGVLRVAAPYFDGRPALVRRLLVKQGDVVTAGQLLAVLDSRARLQAAAAQAGAEVEVARRRLEQVKAGAKPDDIAAQQAEVTRWEVVAGNARREYRRYETLFGTHDVTAAQVDEKRTVSESADHALDAARARLHSLQTVRPQDVAVAESQLQAAIANANESRASLASAEVRSPYAGKVLAIHARDGEEVGADGILDLARTDAMYVLADVYETDIGRVRVGSPAIVTSDLFSGQLQGKVELVGQQVTKGEVLPSDPMAYVDRRVVPVKIRLDDGHAADGFIHGKVSVRIQP